MSWLEKVKKYVNEFQYYSEDDEYFVIIPKKEVDGVHEWLESYVRNEEGNWLLYELHEIANVPEYYILRLSI